MSRYQSFDTYLYALVSCFGFRSKNGFFEEALTGIAITILQFSAN